jgi:hypothetical protein
MPFKKRIAELEDSIGRLRIAIEMLSGAKRKRGDKAKLEKMLGELARLRSERLRLMERQNPISG